MFRQNGQQGVTDQGHVGQQVGISAAGTVLPEDHITPPMISHLNASPVPANERQPLSRAVLFGQRAGEVIVGFGGSLASFLNQAGVADHDPAARKREVSLHGFDGEGMHATGFDSSVAGFGDDKRGAPLSAWNFWACFKRRFWLALICQRYSPPFSTVVRAALRWQCSGSAVISLPSRVSKLSSRA